MTRRRHELISACLGFGLTGAMVLLLGYVAFVNGFNMAAAACGAAYGLRRCRGVVHVRRHPHLETS